MRKARLGREWSDFVAWCQARRLRAMPAHPWTVAAYARWCESRYRLPGIVARIRIIARAHLAHCRTAPDSHPIVLRTLRAIENRQRHKGLKKLFRDKDFAAVPTAVGASADDPSASSRRRVMRSVPRLVRRRAPGGKPVSEG